MARYQIGVVVGSLRKDSFNRKLASSLAKLAPALGTFDNFTFQQIEIGDLPLYNQDDDGHPTTAVTRLRNEIAASQGILFVTPEYNHSVPGVLKNAIDHASRPYGQSAWTGKPTGIIGVSENATGTALAQQHLRNIVASLDMPTLAQPEAFVQIKEDLFNADGTIGDASKAFLQNWLEMYLKLVTQHAK